MGNKDMAGNNLQDMTYLQAMGIQVWLPRETDNAGQPADTQQAVDDGSTENQDGIASVGVGKRSREDIQALLQQPVSTVKERTASTLAVSTSNSNSSGSLDWKTLQARVSHCYACGLHETRTQTVFGVGNQQADWLIIGEAPGAEEDKQGKPFVGPAGQLLDNMLLAMGLLRDQVYIANILKCRPPNNRDPRPEESTQCEPYLVQQVQLLRPKIILAVGRIASQNLLKTDLSLADLRGKAHHYQFTDDEGNSVDIPVVVTYHPAYLLRSPKEKRKAWQDLQFAMGLVTQN